MTISDDFKQKLSALRKEADGVYPAVHLVLHMLDAHVRQGSQKDLARHVAEFSEVRLGMTSNIEES